MNVIVKRLRKKVANWELSGWETKDVDLNDIKRFCGIDDELGWAIQDALDELSEEQLKQVINAFIEDAKNDYSEEEKEKLLDTSELAYRMQEEYYGEDEEDLPKIIQQLVVSKMPEKVYIAQHDFQNCVCYWSVDDAKELVKYDNDEEKILKDCQGKTQKEIEEYIKSNYSFSDGEAEGLTFEMLAERVYDRLNNDNNEEED